MNVVKCLVEGCNQEFRTEEPVSEDAKFLCRHHALQMPADLAPKFQDYKFDPYFPRGEAVLIDEKNSRADEEEGTVDGTRRHIRAADRAH